MHIHAASRRVSGHQFELAFDGLTFFVVAQVVEDGNKVNVAVRRLFASGHRPEQHHAGRPAVADRGRGPLRVGHRWCS